jgi:hypothetical protein
MVRIPALEHISGIAVVGRETNNGRKKDCHLILLLPNLLFCRWSECRHWSIFQALLLLVGRPTTEEIYVIVVEHGKQRKKFIFS